MTSKQHDEWLALGLRLRFCETLDAPALMAAIEACEAALRASFPQVR